MRVRVAPRVDYRVREDLQTEGGRAVVTRHLRDDRGEVAAGTVAEDGEPRRVATERGRILGHPLQRRVTVVGRSRVSIFRSEAVVGGDDDATTRVRHASRHGIVRVEIAQHPASTVEEDDHGEVAVVTGPVDAHRDLAAVDGDRAIFDVMHWFTIGLDVVHGFDDAPPRLGARGHLVQLGKPGRHGLDQRTGRRIDGHRCLLS